MGVLPPSLGNSFEISVRFVCDFTIRFSSLPCAVAVRNGIDWYDALMEMRVLETVCLLTPFLNELAFWFLGPPIDPADHLHCSWFPMLDHLIYHA